MISACSTCSSAETPHRSQGANSSTLAVAVSVAASSSVAVLDTLQTAATNGSLQGALASQVSDAWHALAPPVSTSLMCSLLATMFQAE